ncbi:hypothetical protein BGX28_005302 [Mortierella sp. GBA30]|nr:hypothetical protein BGX28_005302 [Mortierella sp. GBA30]
MSAENLHDRPQDLTPPSATFATAHDLISNDNTAEATGPRLSNTTATPNSAAAVKAAMQARRLSRGLGEGLRPDFVFPKPQQTRTPPSASTSATVVSGTGGEVQPDNAMNGLHRELSGLSISDQSIPSLVTISATEGNNQSTTPATAAVQNGESGSLAPPKNQQQQHLKTHYRTHSRNGSTVTVQDLKQAIAAVSTDLLDLPSIAVLSNNGSDSVATSTQDSAGASSDAFESTPATSAVVTAWSTSNSKLSTVAVSAEQIPEMPVDTSAASSLPPLSSFSAEARAVTPEVKELGDVPTDLGLQMNAIRRYPSLDSFSAPSTPLRDSYAGSPLSPSTSSRPSSMVQNRTCRDRSNVAVPPFFAYSIPHEFPSPYTSPRLMLPGAVGPTSLPVSPFARKRKHAYHYTTVRYPSPDITVKLSGQDQRVECAHHLPVGIINDVELCGYDLDQQDSEQEEEDQQTTEGEANVETDTKTGPAPVAPVAHISPADKRMSWASMVSMDEDMAPKPVTVMPAASQPYRPPGSRLRAATIESKSSGHNSSTVSSPRKSTATDAPRPLRRASPTQEKDELSAATASVDPTTSSPGRARKAAPPPLNLSGSNAAENSAPISPTTPSTPSRRRRSRSQKNNKDKTLDGAQVPEKENDTAEPTDSIALEGKESVSSGDGQSAPVAGSNGATTQPKKTRTRSRSRSRSRSRHAQTDNSSSHGSSSESVPPVPQTPSWVPVHNMNMASSAPSASLSVQTSSSESNSPSVSLRATPEPPMSPTSASAPFSPSKATFTETEVKRRGPRPARLLSTRSTHNLQLQTVTEGNQVAFSPRSARDMPSDYFSMRPLQHPPRTPMTPGGDGDDDDDYYGRLQMVTTPMIQNGFFPNWAKGDAQLEELERIRMFLSARQYPDEMPLSDEWTLFFSDTSRAKDKTQVHDAYSSAITPLFSCHTVPQFATSWKYVRERVRPATMKVNQNLHWFKKGIKPMWEDPKNKYGGRLTLCPPRAMLDTVWETVLILMAGDVLDHHGEGTGAVFARRARGDRVEVWLGADDTPEALAHIRGVLIQELASSGADELVRTAKYKKHFDGKREEKLRQQQLAKEANAASSGTPTPVSSSTQQSNGLSSLSSPLLPTTPRMMSSGLSSPLLPTTPRMGNSGASSSFGSANLSEFQSFEAFTQYQQQQQLIRERERERDREASKEQERIMQLGKERLEKERAERDRLRDEKVRAMAAAAMAASEAKHQQQLKEQREREQQQRK